MEREADSCSQSSPAHSSPLGPLVLSKRHRLRGEGCYCFVGICPLSQQNPQITWLRFSTKVSAYFLNMAFSLSLAAVSKVHHNVGSRHPHTGHTDWMIPCFQAEDAPPLR